MKFLSRTLLVGLSLLLPVALSLQLAIWLIQLVDQWSATLLLVFVSESALFPGAATGALLMLAFLIGITAKLPLFDKLWELPGQVLGRLPGVKILYGMIKDFFDLMSGKPFADQSVVWVSVASDTRLLGIVTKTGEDSSSQLGGLIEKDEVAVFLPMSYQAGGYTLVLPKDRLEPADMEPGEALQLIMSAGLGQRKQTN